jgi:site-specific DNA-methyltransferase (adenine-specific)
MAKGKKSKEQRVTAIPEQGCGSGRLIGGLFPCCTIIRDDCEENLWMLPPGCVDLVIADPPYGMNYESQQLQWERIVGDDRFPVETLHFLINTPRLASYIFCRWDTLCESVATPRDPEGALLLPKPESVITWVKPEGGAGDLDHSHSRASESILFYPPPHLPDHKFKKRPPDVVYHARSGNKSHPTEKPLSLILEIMNWYDFETVLDPYMGSGTTAQAAKELGKHFLGFEIDEKHHKTSIDLLEGPQLF